MIQKRPQWANGVVAEIKEEIQGVRTELRAEIDEMKLDIRALGVGLEEVEDKIESLAEHQMGMDRKLDEHTVILNSHTEMIGNLAVNMTMLEHRTVAPA